MGRKVKLDEWLYVFLENFPEFEVRVNVRDECIRPPLGSRKAGERKAPILKLLDCKKHKDARK